MEPGCIEWMQLQKKKQGQTNFFEIHLTLLHIFYVLFHSDTWMSLGGTRTNGLFKLGVSLVVINCICLSFMQIHTDFYFDYIIYSGLLIFCCQNVATPLL